MKKEQLQEVGMALWGCCSHQWHVFVSAAIETFYEQNVTCL